ncbi:hypothetical protein BDZ89DRAFT_1069657 [Hymenopellis radicata]|nr:hypothetical protein BDZ89DRAFT_1069657 [Hymenopellis radicata]
MGDTQVSNRLLVALGAVLSPYAGEFAYTLDCLVTLDLFSCILPCLQISLDIYYHRQISQIFRDSI